MSRERRPKTPIAGEDADLWRRVAEGVTPLRKRPPPKPSPKPPTTAKEPQVAPAKKPSRRTATVAPPPSPVPPPLRELSHGALDGLDRRTGQRLKRGQLPIEARLDLHGRTQEEAHRALAAFIEGAHAAGRRCVLVVTGKGLRPDGSVGVLRRNVPRWLNQPLLRQKIVAFDHAALKDGGEGALYVLLKKQERG